jgi:ferredoxin
MKIMRKIIEINDELCDGCGQCVPSCAEGAIEIVDGKARLAAEKYCDGLGACLGECPNGALKIVEREAEDFDESAVEAYLKKKEKTERQTEPALACGCPSAQVQTFLPGASRKKVMGSSPGSRASAALTHWPVQINLVPPSAPFLKEADLLVVSDCVPVAYPSLHADFLPGKVILMGCPKFDDVEAYIQKFVDIFKAAHIKSITTLAMEVPCCSGLPMIVKKAIDQARIDIQLEEVVISRRGEILKSGKRAA